MTSLTLPRRVARTFRVTASAALGACIAVSSLSALSALGARPAQAQSALSEASGLSLLPVAVVVAAPALVLSGGAHLSVVAVRTAGEGVIWVLERASDGAQASLQLSGKASVAVGQTVVVTAVTAGWVLSVAGTAVAFLPNEIGRALMHDERLTPATLR
jgi:hypothetical protein